MCTPLWWFYRYSSSWNRHQRLNKACLRQPWLYVLIVASVMLILFLKEWDKICIFSKTAWSSNNLWYFQVVKKIPFSHLICGKKIKRRHDYELSSQWLLFLAPPQSPTTYLTWANCLFCIPLANVLVLVVVCWIRLPRRNKWYDGLIPDNYHKSIFLW